MAKTRAHNTNTVQPSRFWTLFTSMPPELAAHVISYLPTLDRKHLSQVCQQGRKLVNLSVTRLVVTGRDRMQPELKTLHERFPNAQHLVIKNKTEPVTMDSGEEVEENFTDEDIARMLPTSLANMQQLTAFRLAGGGRLSSLAIFGLVMSCPRLETISLSNYLVANEPLMALARLNQLASLELRACSNLSNAGVAHLAPLVSLTSLSFEECEHITDDALQHLTDLRMLKHLVLGGTSMQGHGLVHLAGLPQLEDLDLYDCTHLQPQAVSHLVQLTKLTRLELTEVNDEFKAAGLGFVCQLPYLQKLGAGGWYVRGADLAVASCPHLKSVSVDAIALDRRPHSWFTHLQSLNLFEWTSSTPAHIFPFKSLKYLKVDLAVDADALQIISKQSSLETLKLGNCFAITDQSMMEYIPRLQELSSLQLKTGPQVTDMGLAALGSLTNLRQLWLSHFAGITDASFIRLQSLRLLQKVTLRRCGKVSAVAVAMLAALPEVTQVSVWACPGVLRDVLIHTLRVVNRLSLDWKCLEEDKDIDDEFFEPPQEGPTI